MQGKIVLVTGATTGIGRVTAVELAKQGAALVLVARDQARADATLAEIRAAGASQPVEVLFADLSSLASVRQLAADFRARHQHLDVLVNNAGAIFTERLVTVDGFERTFALNHLSYFLLTNLLLEPLQAAPAGRVVNVSSAAHRPAHLDWDDLQSAKGYAGFRTYCRSKLANILFTYELARRLEGTQVTANCLHPGAVASGFGRNNSGFFGFMIKLGAPFLITPQKGARTSIYLASSDDVNGKSGGYYVRCKPATPSKAARDAESQKRLWDVTREIVGLPA